MKIQGFTLIELILDKTIMNDFDPLKKEPERRRIHVDTQRFLSQGGTITAVVPGASATNWDNKAKELHTRLTYGYILGTGRTH
jgi:hypothetical protein|tara:strand:- start:5665 stop:5913 length:249 start_codon:yes stop_codon:yes gene_type:complete